MSCRSFLLFLLLVFCAGVFCGQARAGAPVAIGESRQIHSSALDEDRTYQVALPASYAWAQDRRYPVLYVLDGQAHFVHTTGSVGYLAAQGEIPEMIVVAMTSTNRVRDFTQSDWAEAWVGGGGADDFKRFLADELIPEIERDFRADGFRMLSGHSAGGQFVLHGLASEPALFKAYFALAPSLDWDGNLPRRELRKALDSATSLPAFLYVARSDDAGQALADYDGLVATLRSRTPEGFRWHEQAFPHETHGSVPLLAQVDALRALYAGYRFHNDRLGQGLPGVEQHFREVSKTLGWPIAIPEGVINALGYAALGEDRTDDAIALFRRNVDAHPNSANAWDSLADGHARARQWHDAAHAADRALALATHHQLPERAYYAAQAAKMHGRLQRAGVQD